MANTIIGGVTFGISADCNGLTTDKLSVSNKSQKKEIRDKDGNICSVAFYGFTSDISGSGYGAAANYSIGTLVTAAAASTKKLGGSIYLDSISFDFSNEDYVKVSWKGTSFASV
jgi:hypothetical protein